ncbi:hypothetical protein CGZ93_10010 [Enemella dayhoffiae]|uniref:Predicted membrane protein YciQ-like C-terminal domain-containing protein n=1 Tax=Enemella dayhoffiae TaxID=2016507 RepID=A0A255H1U1_9ACTN|nr:DUF2207 domain-containing protein [Enemella dayhoffiae]OYO21627.1 hypothetical protein CGZ93_10010 [Enemella dayhoffiae]
MEILIVFVPITVVAILFIFLARARNPGPLTPGKHDQLYAGVAPGVIPARPDEAPTRPTTAEDRTVPIAVRFEPPQGVLPHQVGMLAQAKVDSGDIAACLVGLTVARWISITQLEARPGFFGRTRKPEWQLAVVTPPPPGLVGWLGEEIVMLLLQHGPSTLDDLKPALRQAIPAWRARLAAEPVHRTWYPRLSLAGTPGALGTGVRQRSALGAALRYQLAGFKQFLETADGDRLRFEEGAGIFSRYLPWAIALGVTTQWVAALREAAAGLSAADAAVWSTDLAWYGDFGLGGIDLGGLDGIGDALGDFSAAMDSFADGIGDLTDSISGDISDSGGGGDSGGGDGGGGGGDGGGGGGGD